MATLDCQEKLDPKLEALIKEETDKIVSVDINVKNSVLTVSDTSTSRLIESRAHGVGLS